MNWQREKYVSSQKLKKYFELAFVDEAAYELDGTVVFIFSYVAKELLARSVMDGVVITYGDTDTSL